MYIKKYIVKNIRNIYWQLKGIGVFKLVPVLGLYVLLPLTNLLSYRINADMDYLYTNIVKECQIICPILSVWCIIFLLEHCIEEPGYELLYIGQRNKLFELLLCYFAFVILMLPLFFVYTRMFSDLWWLYLKLCIIQLLYLALAYFMAFLCRKITVSVLLVICYSISAVMTATVDVQGISYYCVIVAQGKEMLQELIPFAAATVVLLIGGCVCNYYFPQRK